MISFVASSHRSRRFSAWGVLLASFTLSALTLPSLVGCDKGEGVTTYTVDRKMEMERQAIVKENLLGKPGRLIGVLLPHANESWFFKILGPDAEVERLTPQIKQFVTAVKFDGSEPVWTVPEGWKRTTGDDFSFVAFALDDAPQPLKLTVSRMPGAQDFTANVNRWRNQLKLAPVDAEEARRSAETIATGGGEAQWVELIGRYSPMSSMRGPFAGGAPGPAAPPSERPKARPVDPNAELPAGHPVIGPSPKPNAAAAGTRPSPLMPEPTPKLPFTYELPEGWSAGQPSQFVMAAFTVSDGTSSARITVSQAGGDMLSNINRWRGELRLPPIEENQLLAAMTKVKLSGLDANYVELIGTANGGMQEATLGIAAPNGSGQNYFVKLKGSAPLAQREKERFMKFVSSIRFDR